MHKILVWNIIKCLEAFVFLFSFGANVEAKCCSYNWFNFLSDAIENYRRAFSNCLLIMDIDSLNLQKKSSYIYSLI